MSAAYMPMAEKLALYGPVFAAVFGALLIYTAGVFNAPKRMIAAVFSAASSVFFISACLAVLYRSAGAAAAVKDAMLVSSFIAVAFAYFHAKSGRNMLVPAVLLPAFMYISPGGNYQAALMAGLLVSVFVSGGWKTGGGRGFFAVISAVFFSLYQAFPEGGAAAGFYTAAVFLMAVVVLEEKVFVRAAGAEDGIFGEVKNIFCFAALFVLFSSPEANSHAVVVFAAALLTVFALESMSAERTGGYFASERRVSMMLCVIAAAVCGKELNAAPAVAALLVSAAASYNLAKRNDPEIAGIKFSKRPEKEGFLVALSSLSLFAVEAYFLLSCVFYIKADPFLKAVMMAVLVPFAVVFINRAFITVSALSGYFKGGKLNFKGSAEVLIPAVLFGVLLAVVM